MTGNDSGAYVKAIQDFKPNGYVYFARAVAF
jgi:hypothetical protein